MGGLSFSFGSGGYGVGGACGGGLLVDSILQLPTPWRPRNKYNNNNNIRKNIEVVGGSIEKQLGKQGRSNNKKELP